MKLAVTEDQAKVLAVKAAVTALAAGRRWGKTITLSFWLTMMALQNPGGTCWYVSLSYARALKQMRVMEKSRAFMKLVKRIHAQFPPRFELWNGSEICFRSLDRPDNLLGDGLVALALDEAARVPEDIWRQYLLPMLADTGGRALVASTFNGRDWFYDLIQAGLSGRDPHTRAFLFPTRSGMKFQGAAGRERLARLRSQFDEATWAQEFECVPMAQSNTVFGAWVDRATIHRPAQIRRGAATCVSLDLGRTVDPTVMGVAQPDPAKAGAWSLGYVREWPLGTDHAVIAAQAAEYVAQFDNPCIVLDATGGASGGREESYVRFYRDRLPGLRPITWTNQSKAGMVGALRLLLEQGRFLVPAEFSETIAQLKTYRYKRAEMSFWVTYGAPRGEHDDHVSMALMLAKAIDENWIPMGSGRGLSEIL
jgi:hypothetical protein